MSKIKAVFIEKMWGYKDVHLELNESINFLIGVNGSGKTTIINIISNALSVDVGQLLVLPFSELAILFTKGEMIRVEKTNTATKHTSPPPFDPPHGIPEGPTEPGSRLPVR